MKQRLLSAVKTLLLALFVLIIVYPFIWQVITSLRGPEDIYKIPADLILKRPSLHFYNLVFTKHDFGRYLFNSIWVSTAAMLVGLLCAVPASYALVRMHWFGRGFVNKFILTANMFPIVALVCPLYVFFKKMGLVNTHTSLIIASSVLTLPISIFTLNAFLKQIPVDLEEAALVDGASRFGAVVKVILPILAPAVFTTAIISFIGAWNELMFSLIFVSKKEMRTVPVAIAMMPGEFSLPWGDIAAASVVATLPLVIVVLICQKKVVAGLTAGAVKG